MIPEFVGRLPIVATLSSLGKDDLVRVMTEPRNAVVRQYRKLFEMAGAELEFAPEALGAIAETCLTKDTGVRAIRQIVESLLLDVLYELPTAKPGMRYVVTEEMVNRQGPVLPLAEGGTARKQRKRESA